MRDVVANGQAKSVGRLPATQPMRLVLVLPHRNQPALDNLLKDLYDPSSPSYRQFLTVEEFTNRFGPSQEDYDAVVSFAQSHGFEVVGTSRNRMNVDISGPVASIEAALHVTMGVYQHPTENRTFYAPDREPTPDLSVRLWHIAGLDNYSIPRPALVRKKPGRNHARSHYRLLPVGFILRQRHAGGILRRNPHRHRPVARIAGVLRHRFNRPEPLTTPTRIKPTNVPITAPIHGRNQHELRRSPSCDDTEQTLDMTQALGMAPGMSSLVMYVGSSDAAIFNAMATASPLNAQLSSSWTWSPSDPATDDPYFQEFAGHGQNLFQAAGDSGAWTTSSAVYPADDVYITSVGGTDLVTSSAGGPWRSETVWVDGGGGISPDKYAIPSWQTTAAAGCSKCSKTYRNAPDVSANANFSFYVCANPQVLWKSQFSAAPFLIRASPPTLPPSPVTANLNPHNHVIISTHATNFSRPSLRFFIPRCRAEGFDPQSDL